MSTLLRSEIKLVGCGRTDTGVHALEYYAHFDYDGDFSPHFDLRLNQVLPKSIAVYRIIQVAATHHARYDASNRAYEYRLTSRKDPFTVHSAWYNWRAKQLDLDVMNEFGNLLLQHNDFYTFSKTGGGSKTSICQLKKAHWMRMDAHNIVFDIQANRFLRAMVRMIVAASVQIGLGNWAVDDVMDSVAKRTYLSHRLLAPPQGLFLKDIQYPFPLDEEMTFLKIKN